MTFKSMLKRSIVAGATMALAIFSTLGVSADGGSNAGAFSAGSVKGNLEPSWYIMAPYASYPELNGVVGAKITVYSVTGDKALGFQEAAETSDDEIEKYIIKNKSDLKPYFKPYYSFKAGISQDTTDNFNIYDTIYRDGRNGNGNKDKQKWITDKYKNTPKRSEQTSITINDANWKSGKQIKNEGRILTDDKFRQLYKSEIITCDSSQVKSLNSDEFRAKSKEMKEMNKAILKAFGDKCGIPMTSDNSKSKAGQQYFIVIYCEPICLTSFNTNVRNGDVGYEYICLTPTMAQYGLDKFWDVFNANPNYDHHDKLNSGTFLLTNLAASCRSIVSTTLTGNSAHFTTSMKDLIGVDTPYTYDGDKSQSTLQTTYERIKSVRAKVTANWDKWGCGAYTHYTYKENTEDEPDYKPYEIDRPSVNVIQLNPGSKSGTYKGSIVPTNNAWNDVKEVYNYACGKTTEKPSNNAFYKGDVKNTVAVMRRYRIFSGGLTTELVQSLGEMSKAGAQLGAWKKSLAKFEYQALQYIDKIDGNISISLPTSANDITSFSFNNGTAGADLYTDPSNQFSAGALRENTGISHFINNKVNWENGVEIKRNGSKTIKSAKHIALYKKNGNPAFRQVASKTSISGGYSWQQGYKGSAYAGVETADPKITFTWASLESSPYGYSIVYETGSTQTVDRAQYPALPNVLAYNAKTNKLTKLTVPKSVWDNVIDLCKYMNKSTSTWSLRNVPNYQNSYNESKVKDYAEVARKCYDYISKNASNVSSWEQEVKTNLENAVKYHAASQAAYAISKNANDGNYSTTDDFYSAYYTSYKNNWGCSSPWNNLNKIYQYSNGSLMKNSARGYTWNNFSKTSTGTCSNYTIQGSTGAFYAIPDASYTLTVSRKSSSTAPGSALDAVNYSYYSSQAANLESTRSSIENYSGYRDNGWNTSNFNCQVFSSYSGLFMKYDGDRDYYWEIGLKANTHGDRYADSAYSAFCNYMDSHTSSEGHWLSSEIDNGIKAFRSVLNTNGYLHERKTYRMQYTLCPKISGYANTLNGKGVTYANTAYNYLAKAKTAANKIATYRAHLAGYKKYYALAYITLTKCYDNDIISHHNNVSDVGHLTTVENTSPVNKLAVRVKTNNSVSLKNNPSKTSVFTIAGYNDHGHSTKVTPSAPVSVNGHNHTHIWTANWSRDEAGQPGSLAGKDIFPYDGDMDSKMILVSTVDNPYESGSTSSTNVMTKDKLVLPASGSTTPSAQRVTWDFERGIDGSNPSNWTIGDVLRHPYRYGILYWTTDSVKSGHQIEQWMTGAYFSTKKLDIGSSRLYELLKTGSNGLTWDISGSGSNKVTRPGTSVNQLDASQYYHYLIKRKSGPSMSGPTGGSSTALGAVGSSAIRKTSDFDLAYTLKYNLSLPNGNYITDTLAEDSLTVKGTLNLENTFGSVAGSNKQHYKDVKNSSSRTAAYYLDTWVNANNFTESKVYAMSAPSQDVSTIASPQYLKYSSSNPIATVDGIYKPVSHYFGSNVGWVPVWVSSPSKGTISTQMKINLSYNGEAKLVGEFASDNDITSLTKDSIPAIKAGQTLKVKVSNNYLTLRGWAAIPADDASNSKYVNAKSGEITSETAFRNYMNNLANMISKNAKFEVLTTLNGVTTDGSSPASMRTKLDKKPTNGGTGDASLVRKDTSKNNSNNTAAMNSETISSRAVNPSEIVPVQGGSISPLSGNYTTKENTATNFGAKAQEAQDAILIQGRGDNSWLHEYANGMRICYYEVKIFFGDGNGQSNDSELTLTVNKYESDSLDVKDGKLDAYLKEQHSSIASAWKDYIGYDIGMSKTAHTIVPVINFHTDNAYDGYKNIFAVNRGNTAKMAVGRQTNIHVVGSIYDNT